MALEFDGEVLKGRALSDPIPLSSQRHRVRRGLADKLPNCAVPRLGGGQSRKNFHRRVTLLGDFPISRRLGMPAYQLVVVDDARQGVTEIVRGADLMESCARQWLLQEALGYHHPRWWHVPLVTDGSDRRLAKRSDDVSLARLRAAGTDPRESSPGWRAPRALRPLP